jgi:hypothetical protein
MSDPAGAGVHPLATEHFPIFLTDPGDTDVLLVAMAIFMVAAVIGIGVFYFKLHSLPEQMAHRGQKVQFEIVAVLGLLSLFTHNHLFWIAGLLLAFVPLPDFSTPLISMAQSLGKIAGGSAQSRGADAGVSTGTAGVPLDDETTPSGAAQVPLDDHPPSPPPSPSHGS